MYTISNTKSMFEITDDGTGEVITYYKRPQLKRHYSVVGNGVTLCIGWLQISLSLPIGVKHGWRWRPVMIYRQI